MEIPKAIALSNKIIFYSKGKKIIYINIYILVLCCNFKDTIVSSTIEGVFRLGFHFMYLDNPKFLTVLGRSKTYYKDLASKIHTDPENTLPRNCFKLTSKSTFKATFQGVIYLIF